MFGLFKGKQASPPESAEIEEDPAQAEAAMATKAQCEYGRMIADRLLDPNEDHVVQRERYERILDDCISRADQIPDEFYRGFAVHQIIDLCMAGGDLPIARALLVSVRDNLIREKIFESAPDLKT